jgi:DNA invertase Pin-like site-specific DNA recombinase
MKRNCAILLVRVSTEIQDYEPQIKDLEAYAKSKGYTHLKKIETKESGLADAKSKVGLTQLYDFIMKNTEYKTVFATELSRLARRQSILHSIKEWFIANRVQLYIKDSNYSLFDEKGDVTVAGEMMFSLYGLFAESEMKQKKERFARSKKSLMEMGLSIGGKTLFGYQRIPTDNKRTTLVPDKTNAEIVQTIFKWYVNGINIQKPNPSIRVITLECIKRGFPKYTHSKRNINKLLKEDGYTGEKITNNKRKNIDYLKVDNAREYIITSNKIKYPQIISTELYEAVQTKLKGNNSKADKSSKHTTILARLIICPECGNHFNGNYRFKNNLTINSYRCSGRAKAIPCKNKQSISMSMMDSLVWSYIKSDLRALAQTINEVSPNEDYENLSSQKKEIENSLQKIESDSKELKESIKSMIKKKYTNMADVLSSFENSIGKLEKEKRQLLRELDKLSESLTVQSNRLQNIDEVISTNIYNIEKSKDLLKLYVSYFLNSIDVMLHTNRYTILKLNIKRSSRIPSMFVINGKKELLNLRYLLVDKSNTLKIKAYSTTRPLEIMSNTELRFPGSMTTTLETLFKKLSCRTSAKETTLFYIKKIDFNKLHLNS